MNARLFIAFVLILGLASVMLITANQQTRAEDVSRPIPALVASREAGRFLGTFQAQQSWTILQRQLSHQHSPFTCLWLLRRPHRSPCK